MFRAGAPPHAMYGRKVYIQKGRGDHGLQRNIDIFNRQVGRGVSECIQPYSIGGLGGEY